MNIKFVEPSHKVLFAGAGKDLIAYAARKCYMSTSKGEDSDLALVMHLLENDQQQTEFGYLVVEVECDRGISHEIVRHRHFTFAQQSQRYVNYNNRGYRFILPDGLDEDEIECMRSSCEAAAHEYERLIELGEKPQNARYVLPNAAATTIVFGGDVREWRKFFWLRTSRKAHPMMRKLASAILEDAKKHLPTVFDDMFPGCDVCVLTPAIDDLGLDETWSVCNACGFVAPNEWWKKFKYCPGCARKVER